jgi:endonuclease YncB( thermonuclease family)
VRWDPRDGTQFVGWPPDGRLLANCYVGGEDLNERIVREGWALNFRKYSSDYLRAESEAKRAGAGIWRGEFVPPWEWRAERR